LKAYETTHDPSQLTKVTRLPADPFMFIGKICMPRDECQTHHYYKYSKYSVWCVGSECFVLVRN